MSDGTQLRITNVHSTSLLDLDKKHSPQMLVSVKTPATHRDDVNTAVPTSKALPSAIASSNHLRSTQFATRILFESSHQQTCEEKTYRCDREWFII